MPKRLLLTGAGGFVGHHVLEHILARTDWEVVATDSFRHKGKTDRITQILEGHEGWRERTDVCIHDLCAPFSSQAIGRLGRIDYIIAMASESHVDRSIDDPGAFTRNNVDVILSTLEYARIGRPEAVIVISTDEVYGPLPHKHAAPFPEWATILPSSPYAASKAAQEAIAIAYWRTYSVPLIITNTMNVIGERQDPEKYVPRLIERISHGRPVSIHGSHPEGGEVKVGSRHYLHARNAADALLHILQNLPPAMFPVTQRPDRYNIAGTERIDNLDLAQRVASIVGKPLRYELVDFHRARPGHDPHYGLDPAKLASLGWKPPVEFNESLARTVRWTIEHPEWIL